MANLKEILPVILAGIGGAASPRGADVFNNMAQMMQERQRYKTTEDRALRQEQRADERLGMQKEEHKASTSLNEIKLEEAKAAAEERRKSDERTTTLRSWYLQNIDPELPEEDQIARRIAFETADTKDQMNDMAESYDMPTWEERRKILEENPDGGSLTENGLTIRKAGVQPDGTLQQPADLSIAIMDDKGFQGGIKELMKLREAELSIVTAPQGVEVGKGPSTTRVGATTQVQGDGPGPAQQAAAIDAKRDVVIHQLVKRAALMSGGDKNVFMDAVNDIYVAAGRPVPTEKKATEIAKEEEPGTDLDSLADDIASGIIPNNGAAGVTTEKTSSGTAPSDIRPANQDEGIVKTTLNLLFGGGGGGQALN